MMQGVSVRSDDHRKPAAEIMSEKATDIDKELSALISTNESRWERWDKVTDLWETYPGRIGSCAKLRHSIAEILVLTSFESAYDSAKEDALVNWQPEDWDDIIERLERVESSLSSLRRLSKDCDSKYTTVWQSCLINQLLAPIRRNLEKQVIEGKTGTPIIESEVVKNLWSQAASSEFEAVQQPIFELFSNEANFSWFKDLEQIQPILNRAPFNLRLVQILIEDLMITWNAVLDKAPLSHRDSAQRTSGRIMADSMPATVTPTQAAARLPRERGESIQEVDVTYFQGMSPRDQARKKEEVHKKKRKTKVNRPTLPNRSAASLSRSQVQVRPQGQVQTSNREDSEGPRSYQRSLTTPIKQARWMYTGSYPRPDPGTFDPITGKKLTGRTEFTSEEDEAILAGYRMFGSSSPQRWNCLTKEKFGEILRNRSPTDVSNHFTKTLQNPMRPTQIPRRVLFSLGR